MSKDDKFILFITIPIVALMIMQLWKDLNPASFSSSSSSIRENREIPGYTECIEQMMRTNPRAQQRTCCDKLGGSWSQKGSFGTCKK
jgi:hypothetical protein